MSAEWKSTGIGVEAGHAVRAVGVEHAADAMDAMDAAGSVVGVRAVGVRSTAGRFSGTRVGARASGCASVAALGGLVAAGLTGAVPSAKAHTAGVPIPPENDYRIRWHQPHSARPVDDWEIEVTPVRSPVGRFIATAQVVPDESCWALNVPVAEPATVRVRSVVGSQVSSWTRPTAVPEPGLVAGVTSASGLLALLARRSRRRRAR
ncbi:MAG: hypothetical protein IPK00_09380 [Deltaproteobacteria bacterium]|nr:hypothetical protein [Deltaproteobacteria bacterium]